MDEAAARAYLDRRLEEGHVMQPGMLAGVALLLALGAACLGALIPFAISVETEEPMPALAYLGAASLAVLALYLAGLGTPSAVYTGADHPYLHEPTENLEDKADVSRWAAGLLFHAVRHLAGPGRAEQERRLALAAAALALAADGRDRQDLMHDLARKHPATPRDVQVVVEGLLRAGLLEGAERLEVPPRVAREVTASVRAS